MKNVNYTPYPKNYFWYPKNASNDSFGTLSINASVEDEII